MLNDESDIAGIILLGIQYINVKEETGNFAGQRYMLFMQIQKDLQTGHDESFHEL